MAVDLVTNDAIELLKDNPKMSVREGIQYISSQLTNDPERRALRKMTTVGRRLRRAREDVRDDEKKWVDTMYEEYGTHDGQRLLLDIYEEEGIGKAVIFASDNQLKILKKCETVHGDGTFGIVPKPYKQVYILLASFGTMEDLVAFPVAFILMTHKNQALYQKAFQRILSEIQPAIPNHFILDQEAAVFRVIRALCPSSELHLCWLHFRKTFWRNIVKLNLRHDYNINTELSTHLCCFARLAFLPPELVPDIFDRLLTRPQRNGFTDEVLKKVYKFERFFQKNYIGRQR